MEAADGADLFGWHSSMVVLEDGKDGEEGSDWDPFDELDPAVHPTQQWGSQTGERVHPTQIPLQPT